MSNSDFPPPMTQKSSEPHWGKIILIVMFCIAAFMMILLIGLALMVPRGLNSAVDRYTSTEASIIQSDPMPEEEWEVLEDRVDAFADAIDDEEPANVLVLTEAELNALLIDVVDEDSDDLALRVQLEEDRVIVDVSIPLDTEFSLGPWSRDLRGRYLNGQAAYDVRFADGELEATLASFSVNGRNIPSWILAGIQEELDADALLQDPDVADILAELESVIIEDGEVTLTPVRLSANTDG